MDNVRKNQGNLLVWQAEHLWSLQFIHLFIPKSKSCRNVSVSHTSTKLKGCWSHVNHFSFVLFFPSFLSEGNLPSPALYTSWPRGTLTTKLSAQRCKKQHGDCNLIGGRKKAFQKSFRTHMFIFWGQTHSQKNHKKTDRKVVGWERVHAYSPFFLTPSLPLKGRREVLNKGGGGSAS